MCVWEGEAEARKYETFTICDKLCKAVRARPPIAFLLYTHTRARIKCIQYACARYTLPPPPQFGDKRTKNIGFWAIYTAYAQLFIYIYIYTRKYTFFYFREIFDRTTTTTFLIDSRGAKRVFLSTFASPRSLPFAVENRRHISRTITRLETRRCPRIRVRPHRATEVLIFWPTSIAVRFPKVFPIIFIFSSHPFYKSTHTHTHTRLVFNTFRTAYGEMLLYASRKKKRDLRVRRR